MKPGGQRREKTKIFKDFEDRTQVDSFICLSICRPTMLISTKLVFFSNSLNKKHFKTGLFVRKLTLMNVKLDK